MKIYDFPQGSDAWHKARAGIITASHLAKILTKKDVSKQFDAYENRLVFERLTGHPIDDFKGSYWIERGKELEGDAVKFYEMTYGVDCTHAGLIVNDEGTFGASPDFLVGEDAGGELKCPSPAVHIGYLLKPESLYADYFHQVQGNLFASKRKWWDVISYHPDLKPATYRATPDYAYMARLNQRIKETEQNILNKIAQIQAM